MPFSSFCEFVFNGINRLETWFYEVTIRVSVTEILGLFRSAMSGRCIGRRGAIEWPTVSPDLKPGFLLWGQKKVHTTQPDTIGDMLINKNK